MPSSVGTVFVDVRFNVGDIGRQLQTALAGATSGAAGGGAAAAALERTWAQSLGAIGDQAVATGKKMTLGLSVPLALIGKSAVGSFQKFDSAMTQIQAINQESAETTDRWRTEVRDLGKEYGVAAEEAAAALYFITSSGVKSADAMDVLETSVKASAVGLGETKDIADVLTSAMSAYGSENLSAAKAADILTEAVHQGKGEADELAGSLSQVIPIAANLGVSFGEVSGAMAAMTLSGTSSDQAATQLRALFNTLQDMPPIAQRALKEYTGLEYEQVRFALTSEGLIPTLKAIYDGFGQNKEAMAEVFGNIRALTGVFNLFGQNTERTLQIIQDVTNASGELNDAWAITADSKAKKLDIAMNTIHDSMIGLGSDVIPAITGVATAVGGLAQGFGALPEPLRQTATAFGLVAAAAGPAAFIFGKMAQGIRAVGSVVTTVAPSLGRFASGLRTEYQWMQESDRATTGLIGKMGGLNQVLGGAGALLAGAAASWAIWNARMAEATQRAEALGKALSGGGETGGIGAADSSIAKAREQIEGLKKEMSASNLSRWNPLDLDYFGELGKYVNELEGGIKVVEDRKRLSQEMADLTGKETNAIYDWLAAEQRQGRTYTTAQEALDAFTAAYLKGDDGAKKFAQSTLEAKDGLGALIGRAKEAGDLFFNMVDAEEKQADAVKGVADANKAVTDAQDDYADAQQRTIESGRKIVEAERKAVDASNSLRDARLGLVDAQNELNDALRGPSEDERLDVQSAQLGVQEAQKRLRGKFEDPLDRQRAQIDLRRAQLDLERTQGEHDKRVVDARKGVADAQKNVNDAVQAELDAKQGIVDARNAKADASKAEADAFDKIGIAQLGVAEAEKTLFTATDDMTRKQQLLSDAIGLGTLNGSAFLTYLDKLKTMYPESAGVIDQYTQKFNDLWKAQSPPPKPPEPPPKADLRDPNLDLNPLRNIFGRASGGPLSTGQLSTVNERGMPELWSAGGKQYLLPTSPGNVIPLRPAEMGAAPKGGDSFGDIIVQGATEPVATAYEVRRQLRAKTRAKARS